MDQTTECVTPAAQADQGKTFYPFRLGYRLYYWLTAYYPRRLPLTIDEFMRLKEVLTLYYGVMDRPDVWFTVASQMTAGKPTSIRRAYVYYANIAKRLPTNRLVKEVKLYFDELNEKLLLEVAEKAHARERAESTAAREAPLDPDVM